MGLHFGLLALAGSLLLTPGWSAFAQETVPEMANAEVTLSPVEDIAPATAEEVLLASPVESSSDLQAKASAPARIADTAEAPRLEEYAAISVEEVALETIAEVPAEADSVALSASAATPVDEPEEQRVPASVSDEVKLDADETVQDNALEVSPLYDSDVAREPSNEAAPWIAMQKGRLMPLEYVNQKRDVPARTVFFELNPVHGAKAYNIQVVAKTQKWSQPYTANIRGTSLRLRLTPGEYQLRTRSLDGQGRPGRWSHWSDFWVHFRAPTNIFPTDEMTIEPKGEETERVTFEWPRVQDSVVYVFSLFNSSGQMIRHVRTPQTWLLADLKLGQSYTWTLVPLADKDEPEPPDPHVHKFTVALPNKDLRSIKVEIAARPRASSYDFEFVRFINEKETGEPTVYNSKLSDYRVALRPGEYEMRVRTNYDDGSRSNWTAPNRFWIRAPHPERYKPVENAALEPTDDIQSKVDVSWQKIDAASRYQLMVWDENNQLVDQKFITDPKARLGLPHDHIYRWSVYSLVGHEAPHGIEVPMGPALAGQEGSREPASDSTMGLSPNAFETAVKAQSSKSEDPGTSLFSIGKYKRLNLSVAEEPSQVYAWGRYLASNMRYNSVNYDNNTRMVQDVFGGTGELAAGYWYRKRSVGMLAAASHSGFRTVGKIHRYSYGSLLLGYRTSSVTNRTRWRFWGGVAYKETPEILRNYNSGDIYFATLKAWGPEARISYLGDFNTKYGYQLYGSYVAANRGLKTVNNLSLRDMHQMNLGAYVTRRLREGMVGMLGYSYQVDAASYKTIDPMITGNNSFDFSGHYLSLTLQLGLEKPMR